MTQALWTQDLILKDYNLNIITFSPLPLIQLPSPQSGLTSYPIMEVSVESESKYKVKNMNF